MLRPKNKYQKNTISVILLSDCLAKSERIADEKMSDMTVEMHCRIVGDVAKELIKRMPEWLSHELFPKGSELIAAAHDIGKVSPTFQKKINPKADINIDPDLAKSLDKCIGYHFTVSQAALSEENKCISKILGRHHGNTPMDVASSDAEKYGGKDWQKQRTTLLVNLKRYFNADWPKVSSERHSDVLSGLTTVADWIGSGPVFENIEQKNWKDSIIEAVDKSGFVAPKIRKGLTFDNIFKFSPRSIQKKFAESVKTQGVYVLEAPMGVGKTEAALFAAYKALEEGRATGIYFALPTQLTSDRIYDRMNCYLEKILEEQDENRRLLLLHGSAWLKDTEIGEEGSPGSSWFNSSKRGLLAPFAVGTIDQALMAVMNVKHGFVRAFGLAGKVVILDEVHCYDNYTGTILKELVEALRELQCTVIILSATLTDDQRLSIMGAKVKKNSSRKRASEYPLISLYTKDSGYCEVKVEKPESSKVNIHFCKEDIKAIDEVLLRAERGEQVIWIENTVNEAQRLYCLLAAKGKEINVECGLLHSRFIKKDRQKKENEWVGLFGKDGHNDRKIKGRILVGTQVLEQSLDIDADFLVTRICPTDMIFQRIGRLWRHRANDDVRYKEAKREVWILSPDLKDAVNDQKLFGKSEKVYSSYVLCRTLEVWQNISYVSLPGDIRQLLELTYRERDENENMLHYKQEVIQEREKLQRFALHGISRGGKTLPESKASTRYSETESSEVLLIKKKMDTKIGVSLQLLGNSVLLLPKKPDAKQRRQIGAKLLMNTVHVPVYIAPGIKTHEIEWLRKYVYIGDYDESPFRVAFVKDSDELEGVGASEVSKKYDISYNSCLGYYAKER